MQSQLSETAIRECKPLHCLIFILRESLLRHSLIHLTGLDYWVIYNLGLLNTCKLLGPFVYTLNGTYTVSDTSCPGII